jgi:hypothetical protein
VAIDDCFLPCSVRAPGIASQSVSNNITCRLNLYRVLHSLAISIFENRFSEHRNRHKIHASLEQEDYVRSLLSCSPIHSAAVLTMRTRQDEDFDEDPSVDDDTEGVISKISFEDLVKEFPDVSSHSSPTLWCPN